MSYVVPACTLRYVTSTVYPPVLNAVSTIPSPSPRQPGRSPRLLHNCIAMYIDAEWATSSPHAHFAIHHRPSTTAVLHAVSTIPSPHPRRPGQSPRLVHKGQPYTFTLNGLRRPRMHVCYIPSTVHHPSSSLPYPPYPLAVLVNLDHRHGYCTIG
jgi:hypothetical protein